MKVGVLASMNRVFDYVDKWARETPDAEAIVFDDLSCSYSQLAQAVDQTAKALLAFGVQPGDRVAMIAMACPEFMISFMAAAKVGASWLGINPKFSTREIGYILNDCRPKVLIALNDYMGKPVASQLTDVDLEGCGVARVLVIGEPINDFDSFSAVTSEQHPQLEDQLQERASQVSPDSNVLLMYTSGSTGKPKGVVQTHASILTNVEKQVQFFYMDRHSRSLLHFPINHVAADVEIGYATIYAGGCLVMMDRFDPAETLAVLARHRVTMLGQIPAMFLMQAGLPQFASTDFSSLRVIVWGGAPAPKKLLQGLERIATAIGAKLITGYGSTEACGFVTYTHPEDSFDILATSVGRPPEGFEVSIVDDNRQPVAQGCNGELALKGPFLFKGYLNQPQATAECKDSQGWFYTGDLGYMDANGIIYLSGRKSEMYKTGGENVFPQEIEEILASHPAVAMAAVVGIPDPLYQEVGYAVILPRPGNSVTGDELREYCRSHLANFKVPKCCEVCSEIPLLHNGKVNKVQLKNQILAKRID
jgi:acyl-CoA synthetase (AMP-forming)/AMP-acid ligase II